MKSYVGITDGDWFDLLRAQPDLDEVNFWQPGGNRRFRLLTPPAREREVVLVGRKRSYRRAAEVGHEPRAHAASKSAASSSERSPGPPTRERSTRPEGGTPNFQ